MKGVSLQDRPREKLDRLGAASLGENELLAIVLGHGYRNQPVLDVANRVLADAGGLVNFTRLSGDELMKLPGVGRVRAAQILAAVELGRRTLGPHRDERVQLLSPRAVATYLMPRYGAAAVEQFGVVLLDARHRVLKSLPLTVGTMDASVVHPRELFRAAIAGRAVSIVLFHNHPSGDPSPSTDDIALTRRLVEAGSLIGIPVMDHIILAHGRYTSFKENRTL